MKWYLFIGGTIIVIAAGLLFFFSGTSKDATSTPSTPGLPVANSTTFTTGTSGSFSTSTAPMISVAVQGGGAIAVKDFVHNGETVLDVQNPGSYVLAGSLGYCLTDGTCPAGASTTDFSVSYNDKTNFFNIVLLKEPLGTIRLEAEQFLQNRLDITEQQACGLNYFVGTPYWVNSVYDDRNLGFSFCPGATVLPK